jgi:nitroreductase
VVSRWALRVNPSSGNLHPTEGYLVNAEGVFHYAPEAHELERRAGFEPEKWAEFAKNLPEGAFMDGLTSIHWREAWKYGERAFRYCQHDVGHALGALGLSAALQGWKSKLIEGPGSGVTDRFLGMEGQKGPEKEHGDCLVAVWPDQEADFPDDWDLPVPQGWAGTPNVLSEKHHDWPIISEVAEASIWPGRATRKSNITAPCISIPDREVSACDLIRKRRSAVALDGKTTMTREAFYSLLGRLLPFPKHPVFEAAENLDHVSLAIFVHRVDGLQPGLYVLVRHPDHEESLRENMRENFSWSQPEGYPAELPLFVLDHGDLRSTARQLSCGQDIAAMGAFSLGMLARFDHALNDSGPGMYPRLFWETGVIGQMLYLEAEAAGLRGTGIGCFFDDEVHRALGIEDRAWQSLYHFTVGGAVDDDRLQTGPAY